MADVALAVPGLFSLALYGTAQIRLKNAEVRLTRWAESVGMPADITTVRLDLAPATKSFEQLDLLFGQARRKSLQYSVGDDGVAKEHLYQPATEKDRQAVSICEKMTIVSSRRFQQVPEANRAPGEEGDQAIDGDNEVKVLHNFRRWKNKPKQGTSKHTPGAQVAPRVIEKAKWALFDKDIFEQVIDDITNIMNDLDNLFPASKARREDLARREVDLLGTEVVEQVLEWLSKKEAARDKILEEALVVLKASKEPAVRESGTVTQTNHASGNGKVLQGANFRDVTM
ncbi:hypothetical protein LTR85_000489 [Meristemomyces frigidus]|nr:hypothetical protein LTR85_000489 [Meristemomyces frigidus]